MAKSNANSLTKSIVTYMNINGYKVWRNNNTGVYDPGIKAFRKNPNNLKGVSDVIGFRKGDGRFIAIEVKVGKDRISPEQAVFIEEVKKAGGVSLVARSLDTFIEEVKPHIGE